MPDAPFTANARALGSWKADQLRSHGHGLPNLPSLNGSGSSWKSADVPYNGTAAQTTASAGGSETRPVSTAYHPRIHA